MRLPRLLGLAATLVAAPDVEPVQRWLLGVPEAVAVTGTRAFVADRGSVALVGIERAEPGRPPATLATWPALRQPVDVAVHGDTLLCLDRFRLQVVSIAPDGATRDLLMQPRKALADPEALVALPDGALAVLDAGLNEIVVFDASGRLSRRFGSFGTGLTGMKCPHDMALSTDGVLFVADAGNRRIQRYRLDGECLGGWGSHGDGPTRFRDPTGVELLPDGNLLVADHYGHRLQVIDTTSGTEILERRLDLKALPGRHTYPTRVAVSPDGRCLVTSAQIGEVWELACP